MCRIFPFLPVFFLFINILFPKNILAQGRRPSDSTASYVSALNLLDSTAAPLPCVAAHLRDVQRVLKSAIPIMRLPTPDSARQTAQNIALADERFRQYLYSTNINAPFRNAVFGVYPARKSDIRPEYAAIYEAGGCFRVEIYNFPLNLTLLSLVSLPSNKVFDASVLQHTAPDIPPYLKQLALQIAIESPDVLAALGFKPTAEQALMADTKTALNRTRCERSQHLCVAPTFIKNDKALWAIIDLTDLRLVGVRWTNTGQNPSTKAAGTLGANSVTQRGLEYEYITECFCKEELTYKTPNWTFQYMLTSSDGLRIRNVQYKGKTVVSSAKLVDWHVSYSKTDGFGYSDAVGCPFFSTATVLALEPPRFFDLFDGDKKVGFTLEQGFHSEGWPMPCNYNYIQRFEFYDDGSMRCATASVGRGCGNDGTYRPVFRIAFPQMDNGFAEWNGNDWQPWQTEKWQLQTELTPYQFGKYQYKIENTAHEGFFIAPAQGKFRDGGRGDNAFVFVTKNHTTRDEGETDLVTIGPCCNTDYHQGPEQFIEPNPDPISSAPLVLWYVPQMKNDDTKGSEYCWAESYLKNGVQAVRTFPCFAGPLLVPIRSK